MENKDKELRGLVTDIVMNMRQGVIVVDRNNHIVEINDKASKILGIYQRL